VNRLLRLFRDRFRHAIGADDPPERVAAAWAAGLALAFSPLVGFHTVLALVVGLVFRLSKPDVVIGTTVMNPWTMPIYYPAAMVLGTWLTGIQIPLASLPEPYELLDPNYWGRDKDLLLSVFTAWAVGSALCSLAVGVTSYQVLRRVIATHRRHLRARLESPPRPADRTGRGAPPTIRRRDT
jgi:uncharacterized protein